MADWGKPTSFSVLKASLKANHTTIKLKILQCTCFYLSLYNPEVLLILSVASTLSLPAKAVSYQNVEFLHRSDHKTQFSSAQKQTTNNQEGES